MHTLLKTPPSPLDPAMTIIQFGREWEKKNIERKQMLKQNRGKKRKKNVRKEAHETRPVKIKSWSFPGECGYRKQIA